MFKKMFALASVTALMGVVAAAGCSSETTSSEGPEAGITVEAGKEGAAPKEAGDEDAAVEPTTCPPSTPITAADIEANLKWVAPTATQAVCTQQNIDDLKALFTAAAPGAGVKFVDMKTALGATCAACAFSKDTATAWQPIVELTMGFINNSVPSCFAQLDNAACGKAAFHFETCLRVACPTDECGPDVTSCVTKARAAKGACRKLNEDAVAACPKLDQITDLCGGIIDGIVVSCAGGPDAGIDASVEP